MTFVEMQDYFQREAQKLHKIWSDSFTKASNEIRGDWTVPEVSVRRQKRAIEIANQKVKNLEVRIEWFQKV